jgi:hypothetical protein
MAARGSGAAPKIRLYEVMSRQQSLYDSLGSMRVRC